MKNTEISIKYYLGIFYDVTDAKQARDAYCLQARSRFVVDVADAGARRILLAGTLSLRCRRS